MTENKYDTLLKVSFAVLAVSCGLFCISAYNLYFKDKAADTASGKIIELKTSSAITKRDSLQQVYNATIRKLDENFSAAWQNADTLSENIDVKLAEFNKLRNDITSILKDKTSAADLGTAGLKIIELQQKVNALRNKNIDVETENKRLQALLQQLSSSGKNSDKTISIPQKNETRTAFENNMKPLTAYEMHLFAVSVNNNKETETTDAGDAEKIVGSFSLKNISAKNNAELIVVVLQPDGKVIKNSVWESGIFETKEGRKFYSRKLVLDAGENETQMNFSLNPDRFLRGEYIMQIWYNGNMIGRMSKVLS
jgi:hypothetical protein